MARKMRTGALLAAATLLATAATALGSGTASAATSFYTVCRHLSSPSEWEAIAYDQDDHYVGLALFDQDPYGSSPGDALYATDSYADGWGVVAHLSTGRTASTRGHSSPYTAGPVTGDLPEGNHYYLYVEMAKDGASWTLPSCDAYA
ncbi:hypothetical protein [Streptomyces sp. VRA16 Mangrove soil]|uniref:hypothetical protein n=1 Tax=Streptomyces sp. VRA16 Mangrove soil TaxID=2817434 RepID=UPI001A9DAEC8|nr:hypothetical protein [Streptomyces sp. VRA16 Mangrove soil]MBO1335122.1 hypothetical protein [Streptomyces sp. VRA16 Mangrove soil]